MPEVSLLLVGSLTRQAGELVVFLADGGPIPTVDGSMDHGKSPFETRRRVRKMKDTTIEGRWNMISLGTPIPLWKTAKPRSRLAQDSK